MKLRASSASLPPRPRGRPADRGGPADTWCPVRSRGTPRGTHRPRSGPRRLPEGSGRSPSRGRRCHRSDSCRRSCSSSRRCLEDKLRGVTGKHKVTGRERTPGPEAPPGTLRQLPGQKQLLGAANRTLGAAAPHHCPQAGGKGIATPSPLNSTFPTRPLDTLTVRVTAAETTPPGPSLLWGHGVREPFSNALQPPMCRAAWGHRSHPGHSTHQPLLLGHPSLS